MFGLEPIELLVLGAVFAVAMMFLALQSIYKRAKELGRFDLVLVDEVHLVPKKGMGRYRSYLKDLREINPAPFSAFLSTPCITLRDETEWVETVELGWNVLVGSNVDAIIEKAASNRPKKARPRLYGNGHAAQSIVSLLVSNLE